MILVGGEPNQPVIGRSHFVRKLYLRCRGDQIHLAYHLLAGFGYISSSPERIRIEDFQTRSKSMLLKVLRVAVRGIVLKINVHYKHYRLHFHSRVMEERDNVQINKINVYF